MLVLGIVGLTGSSGDELMSGTEPLTGLGVIPWRFTGFP
jgi:hypothetical protein